MYHLLYVSSATRELNEDDLSAILETARRKNDVANVTGMLLYLSGSFLQVLEGAQEDVLRIFESISYDDRHSGIVTLTQGDIDDRSFDGWTMGFRRFEAGDEEARGVFDLSRKRLDERIPPEAPRDILIFMRNFYRIAGG